jgi:hypothetical protein
MYIICAFYYGNIGKADITKNTRVKHFETVIATKEE